MVYSTCFLITTTGGKKVAPTLFASDQGKNISYSYRKINQMRKNTTFIFLFMALCPCVVVYHHLIVDDQDQVPFLSMESQHNIRDNRMPEVVGGDNPSQRHLQNSPCPFHTGCDPDDLSKVAVCSGGCLFFNPPITSCVAPDDVDPSTCGCCNDADAEYCSPSEPVPTTPTNCFQNHIALKGAIDAYARGDFVQLRDLIPIYGWPMGDWCVTNVASFQSLFKGLSDFNLDLSKWDTSSVTDMSEMFSGASSFSSDLSNWNTSLVTNMKQMFNGASAFNADLSSWSVAEVNNMQLMFFDAKSFNADISSWDISSVTDMQVMLNGALAFDQDLCAWGPKLQSVTSVSGMFGDTSCADETNPVKLATSYYATPLCRTCLPLFKCFETRKELRDAVDAYMVNPTLNGQTVSVYGWPIGTWCVAAITDFSGLFSSNHNNPILKAAFESFNEDLSSWDVSSAQNMSFMFNGSLAFSSNLSAWDVSAVRSMQGMFTNAKNFNADLSKWEVSSVQDMSGMFFFAEAFNSDISNWNVSSVQSMGQMFFEAEQFGHNLCTWGPKMTSIVDDLVDILNMFDGTNCFDTRSPNLIMLPVTPLCSDCLAPTSTPSDPPTPTPTLSCFNSPTELQSAVTAYLADSSSTSETAVAYGWPIGEWCVSRITDFSSLFLGLIDFNEDISNWDVSSAQNMSRMFEGSFPDPHSFAGDLSTWDVSSVEDMSSMFYYTSYFNSNLSSWDVSSVKDMNRMFLGASSFTADISRWNVSSVQDMKRMFFEASSFNSNLSSWDVSSVQDMSGMFEDAAFFNSDISSWNVSSVQDMSRMFDSGDSYFSSSIFAGDLSTWDVSSVQDMSYMFYYTRSFFLNLSSWNVSSVQDMSNMFHEARSFNSDLSTWDVSSVQDMGFMFFRSFSFNSDLSNWDVSSVQDMRLMFADVSSFSQNLCNWGPKLLSSVDVSVMLGSSNCPNTSSPDLDSSPVSPLCFNCF